MTALMMIANCAYVPVLARADATLDKAAQSLSREHAAAKGASKPIGLITFREGEVYHNGHLIEKDVPVYVGSVVETRDGKVSIFFSKDHVVHLDVNTKFRIEYLAARNGKASVVGMVLDQGSLKGVQKVGSKKSGSGNVQYATRSGLFSVASGRYMINVPEDANEPARFLAVDRKASLWLLPLTAATVKEPVLQVAPQPLPQPRITPTRKMPLAGAPPKRGGTRAPAGFAPASPPAFVTKPVGLITILNGDVFYNGRRISKGEPVYVGSVIETRVGSVTIFFDKDHVVHLDPRNRFRIARYEARSGQAPVLAERVDKANVAQLKADADRSEASGAFPPDISEKGRVAEFQALDGKAATPEYRLPKVEKGGGSPAGPKGPDQPGGGGSPDAPDGPAQPGGSGGPDAPDGPGQPGGSGGPDGSPGGPPGPGDPGEKGDMPSQEKSHWDNRDHLKGQGTPDKEGELLIYGADSPKDSVENQPGKVGADKETAKKDSAGGDKGEKSEKPIAKSETPEDEISKTPESPAAQEPEIAKIDEPSQEKSHWDNRDHLKGQGTPDKEGELLTYGADSPKDSVENQPGKVGADKETAKKDSAGGDKGDKAIAEHETPENEIEKAADAPEEKTAEVAKAEENGSKGELGDESTQDKSHWDNRDHLKGQGTPDKEGELLTYGADSPKDSVENQPGKVGADKDSAKLDSAGGDKPPVTSDFEPPNAPKLPMQPLQLVSMPIVESAEKPGNTKITVKQLTTKDANQMMGSIGPSIPSCLTPGEANNLAESSKEQMSDPSLSLTKQPTVEKAVGVSKDPLQSSGTIDLKVTFKPN